MRFAAWLFLTLIWSRDLVSASALLDKTPLEILQSVAEFKKQKPSFTVSTPDKDYFESVKIAGFKRVDPLDYSKITDFPRFLSIQNKLASSITVVENASPQELHRQLLFGEPSSRQDLVLIQDFFPLRILDFNLFAPNLSRLVYLHSGREVEDVSEKSVLKAIHQTSPLSAQFQKDSTFGYPLGYADFTGAVAFSLDAHPIYYNQLARQTWEFFRDLQRSREESEQEEALYLEDLDFLGFVKFLKSEGLVFYYPDPKSSNTQTAGMAFLCQLIQWLNPDAYLMYLNEPKNSDILKTVEMLKKFLNENQSVFKAVSSMEQLLENVTGNNILQNLPDQFNPESPAFDFQLPSTYDLKEQTHRLSFGFLPESFVYGHYMRAAFEVRNKDILAEKERIRLEEVRVRQEREKQRRERMKRSRRPSSADEESPSEEGAEEMPSEETDTEEEVSANTWKTTAAQIVPHTLGKIATLRSYLAIPNSSGIQDKTIYLINGLLIPEIQRSIAATPNYRRSVRADIYENDKDMELYILRLTSTDDRETRRDNQYFASSFFLPQKLVIQNMLPLLNPFYMKAIEVSLWDR
ncbi:MAG: hypothetical protein H3C47_10455 [Candidatus Cloacimonetes bacterium]|nr:hypothetical protein [Candidatus Cloacimonadota bacterium]